MDEKKQLTERYKQEVSLILKEINEDVSKKVLTDLMPEIKEIKTKIGDFEKFFNTILDKIKENKNYIKNKSDKIINVFNSDLDSLNESEKNLVNLIKRNNIIFIIMTMIILINSIISIILLL